MINKEEYERKQRTDQMQNLKTEKRHLDEQAKRELKGEIKDKEFLQTQYSITTSYADRNLVNPNLLDKQEELRRIRSEFEDAKLEKQKKDLSKLNALELQKGLSFKSKSSNPQFLPIKEDIIVDKKEARDLIFSEGWFASLNLHF